MPCCHSKNKKIADEAPIYTPLIPEMGQFGTRSCQIDEFHTEQEKSLNNKKLEVFKDHEREEREGTGDQFEYMRRFNWPEHDLKSQFKIEKLFSYEEDGEELMVWCPCVIIKVLKKDKDGAEVVVKWDHQYIGENK